MNSHSGKRGFALPVAVFALVVVGVLVTGGFFLARQESRISTAGAYADHAMQVAERGIDEVRIGWVQRKYNALDLWEDTIVSGTTDGGEWEVHVTRTDSTHYFAESTGTITEGGAVLSGATRRVGKLLRLTFFELDPPAAVATMGSIEREGNGDVDGMDQDPGSWGGSCSGTQNKTGVLNDDNTQISDGGGNGDITGDPATDEDATMTSDSLLTFGEYTYDDLTGWAEKVYPAPIADITNTEPDSVAVTGGYDCDTSILRNWGDPKNPGATCYNYFPTIHMQGDVTINSSANGQGILLVDGDITFKGGYEFYGIVIARGAVTIEGNGTHLYGGMIAANETGTGSRVAGSGGVVYSSCAVERAIQNSQGLMRPRELGVRSWVDLTSISY